MYLGYLLNNLIKLTGVPKSETAKSLGMLPSSLSKIITGKRLPPYKERTQFCQLSASYLSKLLFDEACQEKLKDIFPVIYKFTSVEQLETFLHFAFQYHFNMDYQKSISTDETISLNMTYGYYGIEAILNQFCIINSYYLLEGLTEDVQILNSCGTDSPIFQDIYKKLEVNLDDLVGKITFNHLFDTSDNRQTTNEYRPEFFTEVINAQMKADYNLWSFEELGVPSFYLCKDQFLLSFTEQFDGILLMNVITDQKIIKEFYQSLMSKNFSQLSFNAEQVEQLIIEESPLVQNLMTRDYTAAYLFLPVGVLTLKDALPVEYKDSKTLGLLDTLVKKLHREKVPFYIGVSTVKDFLSFGDIYLPLVGKIQMNLIERYDLLDSLEATIGRSILENANFVNSDYKGIAVLSAKELSIIYTINYANPYGKIHVFYNNFFNTMIESVVNFSEIKGINTSSLLDF